MYKSANKAHIVLLSVVTTRLRLYSLGQLACPRQGLLRVLPTASLQQSQRFPSPLWDLQLSVIYVQKPRGDQPEYDTAVFSCVRLLPSVNALSVLDVCMRSLEQRLALNTLSELNNISCRSLTEVTAGNPSFFMKIQHAYNLQSETNLTYSAIAKVVCIEKLIPHVVCSTYIYIYHLCQSVGVRICTFRF